MSVDSFDNLSWVYTDVDPFQWAVYQSADGGVTWTLYDTVSGSARSEAAVNSGLQYYIEGQDASGNPVNLDSNIVTAP